MPSSYRDIAENAVNEAANENTMPAVRASIADVAELQREIQEILVERSLTDEYEVEVRGDMVAIIPREPGG